MAIFDSLKNEPASHIPAPWNYPQGLFPEFDKTRKQQKADEIYNEYKKADILPLLAHNLQNECQHDFKLCSLVAYRVMAAYYKMSENTMFDEPKILNLFKPIHYCGGDMSFGRVFSVNMCSFSSPDSIIGFRHPQWDEPDTYFKIIKGLKYMSTLRNWTLFKLDGKSTDDMTAMLYLPLEKNFTIEFAHFPHDADRRILLRWIDS